MKRKRLTQLFPFLLPLRLWQRKFCFYLKMRFDSNQYPQMKHISMLPHEVFRVESVLINDKTGSDIEYQINKVHNLKLAASTMDRVLIKPGETFSFWQLARYAERDAAYKDGLVLLDGAITPLKGGGLCLLSNLLFWLFLHTPLTIVERHAHAVEAFPLPPGANPPGTDATISEGWLDLKMRNDTARTFQLCFFFDERFIRIFVLTDEPLPHRYAIEDLEQRFLRHNGKVYRENEIYQLKLDGQTGEVVSKTRLYTNRCQIGYALADEILLIQGG